jgi:hypothetical protein
MDGVEVVGGDGAENQAVGVEHHLSMVGRWSRGVDGLTLAYAATRRCAN